MGRLPGRGSISTTPAGENVILVFFFGFLFNAMRLTLPSRMLLACLRSHVAIPHVACIVRSCLLPMACMHAARYLDAQLRRGGWPNGLTDGLTEHSQVVPHCASVKLGIRNSHDLGLSRNVQTCAFKLPHTSSQLLTFNHYFHFPTSAPQLSKATFQVRMCK
jgi:hypothetical protein